MSIGRRTRFDRVFDGVNILIMALIMLITLYPLYFTIIASFSDPYEVVRGNVYLFPKGFSLDAYKEVFAESRLWTGYRNSIYYTSVGVVFNLLLTIPAAYTLSKKKLPMRNIIAVYFLIPMYFSGGLIPTYLQVKSLQLLNKPYTLIFLGGVSIYNVVVTRVFFETTISEELYESARIDGASRWDVVVHINIPTILPTVVIMLILRVGSIMGVGFEKVFLLQTDLNLSASRVISTYVYERTLGAGGTTAYWDYSAAIGLFNTFINLILIILTNTIARKVSDIALW